MINKPRNLKKELIKLQEKNREWNEAFNHIIKLRSKAQKLEKLGQLKEAITLYHKSIDFGEQNNRINLNNYIFDINRLIILYGKTKQKSKQREFLNYVISKYPDCKDAEKWYVRLAKIKSEKLIDTSILKSEDIKKFTPSHPTIGNKLKRFKRSLPEFNFYYDMPANMQTFEYLRIKNPFPLEKSKQLRKYLNYLESILNRAKAAENEKNLKLAIEIYEKLIVEEFEGKEPYERLMIIYRKLKWVSDEIRILKLAINFFSNLREEQKKYVLKLAEKYNMSDKALEYINSGKNFFYYGGAFELYNPYPVINKWKERLIKLNKA